MTSRTSSHFAGTCDTALLCGADALGSMALLAAFRFGKSHVHQPS
jgi:hypothetical protein